MNAPVLFRPFAAIGVVGGGLVGLATALHLRQLLPDSNVMLWEKEAGVGQHQNTRNSGVMHAGLHYADHRRRAWP